jgi:hypothetical protein
MTRGARNVALLVLAPSLVVITFGGLGSGQTVPAEAAPLAAVSLGLIPASGPAGMTITAVGSGWTFGNSPYAIYWEEKGGTPLGSFSPDGPGNWSTSITIPAGAAAGAHTVVACEGTDEFEQCDSAAFTVVPPTATIAPTRTRTPTPTLGPVGAVTWTPTRTPSVTPLSGCVDGVTDISPDGRVDLGGVLTTDLIVEVTLADPSSTHVRFFNAVGVGGGLSGTLYTQWPDPFPGTTVEAVPSATASNRWMLTVRDYPLRGGYNSITVDLDPRCSGSGRIIGPEVTYFLFQNGAEPTATPRPDVCGGLGLPADATVINFERWYEGWAEALAREQGVRFEDSLEVIRPSSIAPRSGSSAGASVEGLEFGSATLPIRIAFDRPLTAVGVFVGFPEPQYVSGDVTAILSVYGYLAGGTELELLGSDSTSFPAATTDIIHCLRFAVAEGDIIVRALVEYTDATGNSLAERRLIDDLTIVYAEAELPPDRPPVIEIRSPTDGSSIPGTTVNLRATIREDRELDRVAYQIDGGPETALGAAPSLTDPAAYLTGANFSAALVEPGVPHLISVTAYDSAGQFAADTVTFIVPTPVPSLDLQAVKMEVVQVVQCLDNDRCADNAVPMLLGKPTWVRLYVRAEGGPPRRSVSGRLCRGRVATCDSGMIMPLNRIVPDGDDDPSVDDRSDLEASLNFIVPPVWLAEGTLEMTAFVNYQEGDIDETRGDNNAVQASVSVVQPRSLTVMFMPVTASGTTAPLSEMWSLVDWLSRVFPVARIQPIARAPLRGDFDLSDSSGSGCGRTWNRLMDALRGAYAWGGRERGYLYGMVPEAAPTDNVGGCGEVPGRIASGIVTPDWLGGARIAAQELGHNFGRRHATSCNNADNPDGDYPVRRGHLDDWGIDLVRRFPYAPSLSYDYMGYCGGADNTWTSVYTYLALMRILPLAGTPPAGPHVAALAGEGQAALIGGGEISPDGFTLQHGFFRASLADGIEDGLPPGPFSVRLLDAAGAVVYARDFGLIELSNHEPTEAGHFQIILPDLPEVAEIVFAYNAGEIGRVSASANAPEVSIVEPAGGEDWGAAGTHTIAWQASDADGDSLRFNVQYSADGGVSWSAIDLDLLGTTSIAIDSADLPGGNLLFRVLASDGLNTAESATTAPVRVADKPPMIHLASPADGDWLPAGEAVVFRGYTADLEDVVLEDSAFHWSSDVDGDLGSGPTLWGLPLSIGEHRVTLMVTDRAGNNVEESVTIEIGGQSPADGAGRQVSPMALVLALAGLVLLIGAGAGALYYAMRSRPARR